MYFGCVCFKGELSFQNCDDISMCVLNKQFELLEFVLDYVDLQYDEIKSCCNLWISASYRVFVYGRYRKSRLVCVWLSDLDLSRHQTLIIIIIIFV